MYDKSLSRVQKSFSKFLRVCNYSVLELVACNMFVLFVIMKRKIRAVAKCQKNGALSKKISAIFLSTKTESTTYCNMSDKFSDVNIQ